MLKKERGRFFEHGFEHGRRTERSESGAERSHKKSLPPPETDAPKQRAANRARARAPPETAAPKAANRAERERRRRKVAQRVFAAAGNRRTEKSHKEPFPPPETAAPKQRAASRARARAPPEDRTKSLCRRRKQPHRSGEPGASESAAAKAQKRRGRVLPRRFFITLNVFFNLQRGLRPLPFGKSIFARSRKVTVQDP